MAEEHMPPVGQAGLWYDEVIFHVSRSARDVAKQIARLCGDDSQVTTTYESLNDAVGVKNKSGNTMQYVQGGLEYLVESGWLRIETVGQKRNAVTTFYLMPGDTTSYDEKWKSRYFDDIGLNIHERHYVA